MNVDVVPGAEVFTSDEDKLGEVGEVRGTHFKVSAAMQPDYWLSSADATTVSAGRVVLGFTKDELDDYKLDEDDLDVA